MRGERSDMGFKTIYGGLRNHSILFCLTRRLLNLIIPIEDQSIV